MNHRASVMTGMALLLLCMIGAPGTGRSAQTGKKGAGKTSQTPRPPSAVEIIEENKVFSLLAEQKDKVIVVNFWATWCGPCREEFPELVKLSQKYRDKGVVVMAFSLDDRDALDQVRKFLEDQKVDFPAYLVNLKDQEKFIDRVDKDWPGAIPATFIYDQKGKLAKRLIGAQELMEFERSIKPVLGARSGG